MKAINQKKLDKAHQIILLIMLDVITVFSVIITISFLNCIFLVAPLPYAITSNIRGISKRIEKTIKYLYGFTSLSIGSIALFADFLAHRYANLIEGYINLTMATLFAVLALVILLVIIMVERPSESNFNFK